MSQYLWENGKLIFSACASGGVDYALYMDYARKGGEDAALLNLDNPQGANGGDSGNVLRFLREKTNTGGIDADLLLLNCGLHDIKTDPASGAKQVPIEQYAANLQAIVQTVSSFKPQLVCVTGRIGTVLEV